MASSTKKRPSVTTKPFSYHDRTTPEGYVCGECGASGVKLWREWNTFLDHQTLRCYKCACGGKKQDTSLRGEGLPCQVEHPESGTLAAAIPTEDGTTYWGYTSVPTMGVLWWNRLPGPEWTVRLIKRYIAQGKSNIEMFEGCLAKAISQNADQENRDYYTNLIADCRLGVTEAQKTLDERGK